MKTPRSDCRSGRFLAVALAILGSGWAGPAFGQAGQAGLSFLKLGTSARGIAMADAMTASVSGPASLAYNPAGLAGGDSAISTELMFTHREWISDTRIEFLAGSISVSGDQAVGLSIISTTVPQIEIRTQPGDPEGTFTARNFAAIGSYARAFGDGIVGGISLKFLYEKILIDEASGYGLDLGIQFATPVEHLRAGVSIANLGSMNSLRNESTKLPAMLRLGPAYSMTFGGGTAAALMAADLLYVFPEKRAYVNWGAEVNFVETVAVRGGYQFGSEGRGLTAGLGFRYGIARLDYAYAKLSEDLGDAHSFTVALTL